MNNATGFSALPAGYNTIGCYSGFGYSAYYWSATESDESKAFTRDLEFGSAYLYKGGGSNKNYLFSVRCLCDVGNTSSLPTVITSTVASVTSYSATCGGNVSYNGAVTARGVCWSTSQNPTISNSHTEDGTGTGTFTSDLTGLAPSTTYHVRAYATNSMGTAYGNVVTFTTLSVPVIDARSCSAALTVTDHEGNVYATVQIGDQCWMRDNLRTTTSPSTGTYLIPYSSTGSTFTGKQARWYNNDPTTNAPMNYGLLYNWNAAVDTFNTSYGETSVDPYVNHAVSVNFTGHRRGICPTGWHLPSDSEWTQLTNYVKTQDDYICGDTNINIGKALASTEGWYSYNGECYPGDQSQHANNATGFSAVPAGYCTGLSFYGAGYRANFWSSSQSTSIYAYCHYLLYSYVSVYSDNASKNDGCSVRCLRD